MFIALIYWNDTYKQGPRTHLRLEFDTMEFRFVSYKIRLDFCQNRDQISTQYKQTTCMYTNYIHKLCDIILVIPYIVRYT